LFISRTGGGGFSRSFTFVFLATGTFMSSSLVWSDWQPLAQGDWGEPATRPADGSTPPTLRAAAVLAEVLDGGQAFRWVHTQDGLWQGVWSDCVARLKPVDGGGLAWSAPQSLAGVVAQKLPAYLGSEVNFTRLADGLPWRSDAHLARCLEAFRGLRLLRQPLGETLLAFLCSSTKQIVQIRQMVELLARRHGREIAPGFHRLPTWTELAAVSEEDLRGCLLGFRARYVRQTAQFLAERPDWLDQVEKLPYGDAKRQLRELSGVGEKVADCVLLFGAGRYQAFPVDVWIIKALEARYGLEGWAPQQIALFGRTHFGPNAGLAQQYLFAWERRFGRKPAESEFRTS
jgi:N-glycosylase/DNA lyase